MKNKLAINLIISAMVLQIVAFLIVVVTSFVDMSFLHLLSSFLGLLAIIFAGVSLITHKCVSVISVVGTLAVTLTTILVACDITSTRYMATLLHGGIIYATSFMLYLAYLVIAPDKVLSKDEQLHQSKLALRDLLDTISTLNDKKNTGELDIETYRKLKNTLIKDNGKVKPANKVPLGKIGTLSCIIIPLIILIVIVSCCAPNIYDTSCEYVLQRAIDISCDYTVNRWQFNNHFYCHSMNLNDWCNMLDYFYIIDNAPHLNNRHTIDNLLAPLIPDDNSHYHPLYVRASLHPLMIELAKPINEPWNVEIPMSLPLVLDVKWENAEHDFSLMSSNFDYTYNSMSIAKIDTTLPLPLEISDGDTVNWYTKMTYGDMDEYGDFPFHSITISMGKGYEYEDAFVISFGSYDLATTTIFIDVYCVTNDTTYTLYYTLENVN